MPNRLIHETSPYLLQHADNPVDWYPWGEEALRAAREANKPIFLSIGYAACHWCHVMAHESFEDPETARLLNELFISIKVDREERPDLDDVYMAAVQTMTGSGGWPMSVFLTPAGQPFYGGTYFPPSDRYGMPSFRTVLRSVAKAWHDRHDEIVRQAAQMAEGLKPALSVPAARELDPGLLAQAARRLAADYDTQHGGFGGAPKFPQPMTVEALLRAWHREPETGYLTMITRTLDGMARGGIYDQVGGGFARYSTDPEWLVPHFEKMLYDNAQLVRLYTHAWQATREPLYAQVVAETVDWVLREMTDAAGGFYSTLDADSEGHEGRFYLWSMSEVEEVLGHADARPVNLYYGLYDGPNFEGRNILHVPRSLEETSAAARIDPETLAEVLARARPKLRAARATRVWPARDEKVLAAWNGLMLAALAEAARVFDREDWRAAADRNADFLLGALRRRDGRLLRTWKAGQAKLDAYLEDYAFLIEGLLALYQLTFDPRRFAAARELAGIVLDHFADPEWGYFDTADDAEALIVRPKNVQDNALPSGNASAALDLLMLAAYTGDERYATAARGALRAIAPAAAQYPRAFGYWLCAYDFAIGPVQELAVAGDAAAAGTRALLEVAYGAYRPNLVTALRPAGDAGEAAGEVVPLLEGRPARDGRATAYVCEHFACQLPVQAPDELRAQLENAPAGGTAP